MAAAGAAALALALAGPAWAQSSIDVQANDPQVAGQPASDTTAVFPTNKQNEPSISVSPDGRHLVAGSNDEQEQPPCGPGPVRGADADPADCSFFPGVGTDGYYTSSDAGVTWVNRGLLDDVSGWRSSAYVSDGDPVIAYGPRYIPATRTFSTTQNDVYYQSLASYKPGQQPGQQAPEFIVVSRSSDDGVTWSGPSTVASSHGYIFNDKNALGVDTTVGSPYFGRIYASWTQFRSIPGTAEPVMVAYSADGGRTWSRPNQLSGASNNGVTGGRQGSAVAVDGRGTVYVAWEEGSNQVYSVSRDGGVTYSRARAIGPVRDIADPIPGANFRTDSFLSLAAVPARGSTRVYAAWVNRTSDDGYSAQLDVYRTTASGWTRVATPYAGAVTQSVGGLPFFQGLDVAADGRVDLGWQTLTANDPTTFGTGNASITSWYSSAADGRHFLPPQQLSNAPSDPAASAQNNLQRQFWGDYNTLVSQGDSAWFIYTDARTGQGCPAVDAYQHELLSSGATIQDEEREDHGAAAEGDADVPAPPLVCPSQFGNTDVYVIRVTH
jgi:hypothetical protein